MEKISQDASKRKERGLGRGLSALIPSVEAPLESPGTRRSGVRLEGEEIQYVSLKDIRPNPSQPRTVWDQEKLKELATSIKSSGLLQPLLVRPLNDTHDAKRYELIAGERRFRALQLAGLERAPVIVRAVDAKGSLEIAIVENIQREDLNPIDEALGYQRLIQEFEYSQEVLSQHVGKNRTTVTNSLRLLQLPKSIQDDLATGKITAGHARALLSLEKDSDRLSLEALIIRNGLSVREVERLVKEARNIHTIAHKKAKSAPTPQVRFLEESLMASLGTKVRIKHSGRKGRIEIEYYSLEDLDRLVQLIRK